MLVESRRVLLELLDQYLKGCSRMLPFIALGAVILGATAVVVKKVWKKEPVPPAIINLDRFAIWGRPNSGKTTFIFRILKKDISDRKEQTTSKRTYKDIPPFPVDGMQYQIREVTDMPGTKDRLSDWLAIVKTHEHVFYLLNLSRKDDDEYKAWVRADLRATMKALGESKKLDKKLHVIASHVDKSSFSGVAPEEVNNVLQEDLGILRFMEETAGVKSYLYAVDLTNPGSFSTLIESIVRDTCD